MLDGTQGFDRRQELVDVIRRVRNRWRMKLALRGAVIVVAGTLLALFLSASSLEALRFSPTAINSFRVAAFIIFGGLLYLGLVRPLMRRVSDNQVAMYLEEKDPTLQSALMSAVETSRDADSGPEGRGRCLGPSPKLVERLVEQAIEQCHALDDGLAVERQNLRRQLGHARSHCRRGGAARGVRAGVPAPRPVGAPHRVEERRSGEPLQDRCHARQRQDSARDGPDGQGHAQRVHGRRSDADDPHGFGRRVRARAAHPGQGRRRLRGPALPRRQADRVLRRGQRRALAGVLDDRPGSADGREPRARVPLPRLHQHAAAHGGSGRRHRDHSGHRSPAQGLAHHEDGGRPREAERDRVRAAHGGAGRHARRQLHGGQAGLLPDRARRSAGREGHRVAAVHDRCPGGPGADGELLQAGPRHAVDAGRRGVRRGQGRR